MRSRIFLGTLLGAIGGFLGFLIQEGMIHHDELTPAADIIRLGIYVGAMLGLTLGCVEGIAVSSSRRLVIGASLGFIMGIVGGLFGIYFGSILFNILLFGKSLQDASSPGVGNFIQLVIARAVGWSLLGAFPGMAAGAATLSVKRMLHGLAGGLIGGFVGGILFDLVGNLLAPALAPVAAATSHSQFDSGGPSRAIGFTAIGLFTGLFIGLVEELLKRAWVRVLAGKNEGKDYIISKGLTVLGRDERADVPLFGDPSVAPQHAAIKLENNRHVLLDGGSPLGSVVNGQRITQQLLRDGDMIQIGQVRLLFHERATSSKISSPTKADAPKSAAAPGGMALPSHLCPFCGAQKDAQGNCLCSVPGTGTSPQMGMGGAPSPSGVSLNYGDPMGYSPPGFAEPQVGVYNRLGDPMTMSGGGYPTAFGSNPGATAMPGLGGTPGYGAGPMHIGIGSRLTALDGPYVGQSFPLGPGEISIGRAPENVIPMGNDTTVSRRHASINSDGTRHIIADVGSSNGTYVNNVRISVQPLVPGDVIQFGGSKYRYE